MLRLLRFLFTGWWGERPVSPSVVTLRRDVDDLDERLDYLRKEVRRLRGHVTGGIRYEEGDPSDPDSEGGGFPEGEFKRLLALKQGRTVNE